MKIIKRLICLIKGHKWEVEFVKDYDWIDYYGHYEEKCTRCGKTKEEIV